MVMSAEYRAKIAHRIGKRVRVLRQVAGWSLVDLAKRAKMLPPNVSRVEAGKHIPALETLVRLARALGVSVADLVGDNPSKNLKHLNADV